MECCNLGTGTVMAGQTMAGFFSRQLAQLAQLGAIYTIFRFEVPILQGGYQVIQEHFLTAKK